MTSSTGTASRDAVLRAERLSKSFGNTRAVSDVSLSFRPGEVLALVGENGAGKSTLVAMLSGAVDPDSGVIEIDGASHRSLTAQTAQQVGIGAIRQDPALVPSTTVEENLVLGCEPRRAGFYRRAEARMLSQNWLRSIDADVEPSALIESLSPAQRQQVEVAKAVAKGSRVVFFDEPTAALGPHEAAALFELVRKLAAGGTSVVYVSHRLEEIFELCGRVAVMRDGLLVADRPIHGLTEHALVELMVGHEVTDAARPARADSQAPIALELREVSMGNRLHDVSISFREGVVHGIFGIVGSGRSRLASVIAGLDRPSSGEMILHGEPYRPRDPRDAIEAGVVLVPEDRKNEGLFAELSVATNVTVGDLSSIARYGTISSRREDTAVQPLVHKLDVRPNDARLPGGALSGGNQQKLLVGRALFVGSKVLVLDEPTQGVDVGAKDDIHRIIHELASTGIAVVVISSDLRELLAIADPITVLARGRVTKTFAGEPDGHAVVAAAVGGTDE